MVIYRIIAAIIHLGNVEIESSETEDETHIPERSKPHIDFAAALLDISSEDLMNVLLYRSIDVPDGTQIL